MVNTYQYQTYSQLTELEWQKSGSWREWGWRDIVWVVV